MHYYTIKQIMITATVSANAGLENYQDPPGLTLVEISSPQ